MYSICWHRFTFHLAHCPITHLACKRRRAVQPPSVPPSKRTVSFLNIDYVQRVLAKTHQAAIIRTSLITNTVSFLNVDYVQRVLAKTRQAANIQNAACYQKAGEITKAVLELSKALNNNSVCRTPALTTLSREVGMSRC